MRSNVQYIYLDNSHKQIAVTKEGYQQIKQTIEQYRICCTCECLFSDENPQVSLNWCKECFVRHGKGKHHGLTYIGIVSPEPTQYNGIEHQFIAPDGYIYITGSESEITHEMTYYNKNNRHTLKHWQFPVVPEIYEVKGEEVRLLDAHMHIYGDVRKDAVVFIEYAENYTYSPSINVLFLAYRGGEYQEFNKRKGEGRKLWQASKARLEASKDEHGYYHIKDTNGEEYTRSWFHESDLYRLVATILNEQEAEKKALEQRKAQDDQEFWHTENGQHYTTIVDNRKFSLDRTGHGTYQYTLSYMDNYKLCQKSYATRDKAQLFVERLVGDNRL